MITLFQEENSFDFMNNDYDRLNQIRIPSDNNNSKNIYDSSSGLRDGYDPTWLDHVNTKIEADHIGDMEYSCAAFHARQAAKYSRAPLDISSLLPMFQKEAKSIVMIRHSVNIAKQCVQFLNPGQRPVITCDQPLYALANSVQWNWPNRFSEEQIVVLFGGLHIEKAALRTIGDWLDNSGWTSALSQANIAPLGTQTDSCLRASNVSRTRRPWGVTPGVQYSLMQRSYWLCGHATLK
ncbi:unnamed protein product [Mytilus edulis]|uniref:Uncharacterized protein n=1 Tax=Mytilus edulis TaxID=6550 RepID=A0A8S3TWW3_MYTED|nr:unnamed protein product [Mytilus edulis]